MKLIYELEIHIRKFKIPDVNLTHAMENGDFDKRCITMSLKGEA